MISTLDLLAALKARLSALTLESGDRLFERVEFFAEADLLGALQELRLFKKRICLVVPAGDAFQTEPTSTHLQVGIVREVVVLLGDRDVARPQEASTGGPGNPGVVAMKDQVFEALINHRLGFERRFLRLSCTESQPLTITDATDQPGRRAWQMTWTAHAGTELFAPQTG